ncbi:hypothetical protein [Prosthecobacter sp.]|uniref:tetratricopeptide repeat protein n=1 Tax=Prosthecobacter sp. TaxID=1965333 RepID=UPI002ABD12B7|nr:hypothetical protein [Prosthecobacter sp.]MDZ4404482.1 hypothetical protein [Prosthecobacter sp.]
MQSPLPPKPEISEFDAESLIPKKGGSLSHFAVLAWVLIGLVLLGMTWLVVHKFDLGRLRGPDYFMTRAWQAMETGNLSEALSAIEKVQGAARGRPEFLRLLAEYLKKTAIEPALLADVLEKLESAGKTQPDDVLWLSRARFAAGDMVRSRAAWNRMPASQRSSLMAMKLNIDLLRKEGNFREAGEVERQLFQLFPDEPEIAFRKAVKDLDGTFLEIQRSAFERLFKLASNGGQTGLDAVRMLSRRTELTLAEAEHLLKLAETYPDITPDDRLMIVSTLMRLDPEQRSKRIEAEIERYREGGAALLTRVAAWLAREKEHTRVRELVPEELLLKSSDLFPLVVQGLSEQQKWQELMDLLKKGKKLPVSNARAAGWRALASRNLNPTDVKGTRTHLEEAILLGAAEKNTLALLGAASLAESWNMTDLALQACQALAEPGSPREVQMLEKCWELAVIQKDTSLLTTLVGKLLRLRPDDLQYSNRRDYLRLLRGVELETTLPDGGISPRSASAHLLEALKAYRMHDLAQASAALRKVRDIQDFTTGEKAVYAGLLAVAGGEVSQAYQIAEKIRTESLLQEEKAFLELAR